jgi:hypothetical protein
MPSNEAVHGHVSRLHSNFEEEMLVGSGTCNRGLVAQSKKGRKQHLVFADSPVQAVYSKAATRRNEARRKMSKIRIDKRLV